MNGNSLSSKESETHIYLQHIHRYLRAGFWLWNSETNHLLLGHKFQEALGVKADELGIHLDDFFSVVHPDDRRQLSTILFRLLKQKLRYREFDVRVTVNDVWHRLRIHALVGEIATDGSVQSLFGKFLPADPRQPISGPAIPASTFMGFDAFTYNPEEGQLQWQFQPSSMFWGNTPKGKTWNFSEFRAILSPSSFKELSQSWQVFANGNEEFFTRNLTLSSPQNAKRIITLLARKVEGSRYIQGVMIDTSKLCGIADKSSFLHFYSSIASSHRLLMIELSREGAIKGCNRITEKSFGYSLAELQNPQLLPSLFTNADSFKQLVTYANSGGSKPFVCRVRNREGQVKDISWILLKLPEVVGMEGNTLIGQDVTRQVQVNFEVNLLQQRYQAIKLANAELQGAANFEGVFSCFGQQLERIFPSMVTVVLSYNAADGFITVEGIFGIQHKTWESLIFDLGWNPVGRRFLLHDKDKHAIKSAAAYRVNESFTGIMEGYISMSASKIIERYINIEAIYAEGLVSGNHMYGGVLLLKPEPADEPDLTLLEELASVAVNTIQRIDTAEGLQQQIFTLKSKIEQKDELFSQLSHQLRTPLNAVLGFSQLLLELNQPDDLLKKYIGIINSKGKQLLRLVNDTIDYNLIEKGNLTLVKSTFNLNHLLQQLHRSFSQQFELYQNEGIKLKFIQPGNAENIFLKTDEGRLEQALANLLDGIFKTVERGTIELGCRKENSKVMIFLRISGAGAESKVNESLLDQFRQSENIESPMQSLLGIRMARQIVTLLGGEMRFDIGSNDNAEVEVLLPLTDSSTSGSNNNIEDNAPVYPDFKNKVILIVEDEEVNYLLFRELLVSCGATTLWAKNGREAVNLVSTINQTIHLVVMDIQLPVMDGYAATMEIKQINPKIPVIAETAYISADDRKKAEAAGCDGYITKPIEPKVFYEVLEIFLGT
jgi:CheY-like chemotaxis protein/signal transduction histidine kinase/PAS domain-containing protein